MKPSIGLELKPGRSRLFKQLLKPSPWTDRSESTEIYFALVPSKVLAFLSKNLFGPPKAWVKPFVTFHLFQWKKLLRILAGLGQAWRTPTSKVNHRILLWICRAFRMKMLINKTLSIHLLFTSFSWVYSGAALNVCTNSVLMRIFLNTKALHRRTSFLSDEPFHVLSGDVTLETFCCKFRTQTSARLKWNLCYPSND